MLFDHLSGKNTLKNVIRYTALVDVTDIRYISKDVPVQL